MGKKSESGNSKKRIKKDDIIYCINCGHKVDIDISICTKCEKEVNPVNSKSKIFINEVGKSAGESKVLEIIYSFFSKNAYAMILSLSFVDSLIIPGVVNAVFYENEMPSVFSETVKREVKEENKKEEEVKEEVVQEEEVIEEEKPANIVVQAPVNTCTPKKFPRTYSYVYSTQAECKESRK